MTTRDAGPHTGDAAPGTSRPPTIQDVARLVGVSTGTVSHVLNGSHPVRPETRRRVEDAILQLGFRPNRAARSLMINRTGMVGLLIPDVTNPFFAELIRGAEDTLARRGLTAVIGNTDNKVEKESSYVDAFRELRLDGLIAAAVSADGSAYRQLGAIPLVLVDRAVRGLNADLVLGGDKQAMALAVAHLVDLGHERIALVNGQPSRQPAAVRREAFVRELDGRGLRPVAIIESSGPPTSCIVATAELLSSTSAPTAIVAGNDVLAIEVLAAAGLASLRVPEQLSVVGHDDIALADLTQPRLTTVAQPAYDMGERAAQLLIERLGEPGRAKRRRVMAPRLVVRDSTAERAAKGGSR